MSLFTQLLGALGTLESDMLSIHEERCISIRNRNASCLRCAESCTSQAISYHDNQLTVDQSLCIGCGTCATSCPTSAIEIKKPSDEELTKEIKRTLVASKGHPVIACETALSQHEEGTYDPAQVCAVRCLGRIDESPLVGLGAYRARSATLLCADCDTCEHEPGGRMIREVLEGSRNMLAAFGCDLPITLTTELPEHVQGESGTAPMSDGVSRRDFFSSAKKTSATVAQNVATQKANELLGEQPQIPAAFRKVTEQGTLPQFVPTRRVRVYNYLKHIGEPIAEQVDTRIIGSVTIDAERCDSCRMCAVFCPTGAITKFDEGASMGVIHRPSACMQCRLCEHICPTDAITVDSCVPIGQFMGKKALKFEMKQPTWQPNKPSSMYDKVHSTLGDDLQMCSF